ncbi:hypothetical protein TL16_g09566 [Triparma laevis f. inornata]|uniref:Uncharacterized protein n=1 Tax=Triparma laevis f. inornata TaxID=1714386 RepID=A0A9W7B2X8_9STRA|nr:hypothetical protein TL16_g09566 [Triparma laevis f. inornata]
MAGALKDSDTVGTLYESNLGDNMERVNQEDDDMSLRCADPVGQEVMRAMSPLVCEEEKKCEEGGMGVRQLSGDLRVMGGEGVRRPKAVKVEERLV